MDFPSQGIAEAPPTDDVVSLVTAARKPAAKCLNLNCKLLA